LTDERAIAGEEELIQTFLAPLAAGAPGAFGLTDDCAALTPPPGTDLVLKTDAVAEGVHYLPDDPPETIGWKALAVNASDLAAKGAAPLAYLMALSFPAAPSRAWLAGFAAGLSRAQAAFGCHLVGGDTDRRPGPVSITIMIAGTVPTGAMVRRTTAQAGDRLFVSGTLGDGALGLQVLRNPGLATAAGLDAAAIDALVARYRTPTPRLALAEALRKHASAAMDLSDGLAKDLGRMMRASGTGARVVFPRLPLSAPAARLLAADPSRMAAIAATGDDYEVLAAVPAASAASFVADATRAGVPVTDIGEVVSDGKVVISDSAGAVLSFGRAGWDHF
jgi:thiamine-monophosphate kinase